MSVRELEHVAVQHEPPAARIVLNRPERRNALSLALMQELVQVLGELRANGGVRAIVVEGAGAAFSAGHDLSEMVGRDIAFYQELFDVCTVLMETIHRVPQPVIAKVDGVATAAGCQLVAMCDLAVAADVAKFAVSGINVGLFCSTPSVALSRNVGRKQAFEMLVTGDFIDAATACERGLVNRVVPLDQLDTEVAKLAASIVAKPAIAIALGKGVFYKQLEMGIEAAYQLAGQTMACNMVDEVAQEGVDAFMNKRPPAWASKS